MFLSFGEMVFHLSLSGHMIFLKLSCQFRKVLNSVVDVFCCGRLQLLCCALVQVLLICIHLWIVV